MANEKKYLDENGLLYFWQKQKAAFVAKVSGKGLSTNDFTDALKSKLDAIEAGGQVNVIETVKVNGSALTPDANKAVDVTVPTKVSDLTIDGNVVVDASYVHTDNNYTSTEKTKLSNIEAEANKTIVDSALSGTSENPVQNKVINTALEGKVDKVTGKGLSTNDYTTSEKEKLAGIEAGATNTVVDSALDGSSENPVQNKVINSALGNKVDKVSGKGLSTEDYTTAEKTKLGGVEAGAQVNVKANWNETDSTSDAYIQNKPTKVSDFTNDSGFITNTVNNLVNYYLKSETYTQTEVNSLISTLKTGAFRVVASLPASGELGYIYLVPKSSAQTRNVKDEYIWVVENNEGSWEKIGETEIDLSNYVTKVTGKGLSTNDFTDALLSKLNGIQAGAEVNVQPDWNETDNTADDYIQNKPTIPVIDSTLSGSSTNGIQNKAVYDAIALCVKEADLDAITNAEIDAIIAQ